MRVGDLQELSIIIDMALSVVIGFLIAAAVQVYRGVMRQVIVVGLVSALGLAIIGAFLRTVNGGVVPMWYLPFYGLMFLTQVCVVAAMLTSAGRRFREVRARQEFLARRRDAARPR